MKQPHWPAYCAYQPARYPGRITLFWSTAPTLYIDPDVEQRHGWAELAEGGVELVEIPSPTWTCSPSPTAPYSPPTSPASYPTHMQP